MEDTLVFGFHMSHNLISSTFISTSTSAENKEKVNDNSANSLVGTPSRELVL